MIRPIRSPVAAARNGPSRENTVTIKIAEIMSVSAVKLPFSVQIPNMTAAVAGRAFMM